MRIKLKYIPTIILTLMTAFGGAILTMPYVGAADDSAEAVVQVNDACTFDADYSYTFSLSGSAGTSVDTTSVSSTTRQPITVTCNDINGFLIKAIGSSPTSSSAGVGVDGATDMYGANGTIPTGTSGSNSYWAMKITSATNNTVSGGVSYPNGYNNTYGLIPSNSTTILSFTGSTTAVVTGSMRPDYMVNISTTQPAGSYTGAVKYTIVGN